MKTVEYPPDIIELVEKNLAISRTVTQRINVVPESLDNFDEEPVPVAKKRK